ncbi:TRAP transporter substrate-binding protein DctP [Ramlibacter sp.]|uniref:TRAP transporter substrate-binding protein n=1 Tax=Ramlibacter sp. TaxID=1917967 RepID=UPI0017C179EE|nr:TRAP transporter substrate-binding protein DctP [Ramlibacter sp.]MBA2673445.1 TRAP transporter substrate-binding protein DctP [Ramlibacter sp.]
MERRQFIARAGTAGAAIASVAAPAIAQTGAPEIRWRIASSYPKSLTSIYGAMDMATKRIAELTAGRFNVSLHAAGELVPPLGVLDAVEGGTVEAGHSASYFYIGKDPAFGFHTALPFGLGLRAQNAWLYEGGGGALVDEFLAPYGVMVLPLGNTGAQMAGWYRKEIKNAADLKGLKMRIGGLGGLVLSKLGLVAQQLAAGDLYTALEKGTIDAAEFVGPLDDEKLGLHKVAKYYYFPGWWEGSASLALFINRKAWAALPAQYQAAMKVAAAEANQWLTAKYDTENPQALRRLVAGGAQLRSFPKEVTQAAFLAANELYAEMSGKSPGFRKIYAQWSKFRSEQVMWQQFCDLPFDNMMAGLLRTKT